MGDAPLNAVIESISRDYAAAGAFPTTGTHTLPTWVMGMLLAIDTGRLDEPEQQEKICKLRSASWFVNLPAFIAVNCLGWVIFPFSVNDSHWQYSRLDVERRRWEHANSLAPGSVPKKYKDALQLLVDLILPGGEITTTFNPAPPRIRKQDDHHSCGPLTINGVHHETTGQPILDDKDKDYLRLCDIIRICNEGKSQARVVYEDWEGHDFERNQAPVQPDTETLIWQRLRVHLAPAQGSPSPDGLSNKLQGGHDGDDMMLNDVDHGCGNDDDDDIDMLATFNDSSTDQTSLSPFEASEEEPAVKPKKVKPTTSPPAEIVKPKLSASLLVANRDVRDDKFEANATTAKANPGRFLDFENSCRKFDEDAEFDSINHPLQAFCSSCCRWQFMQSMFSTTRFREHRLDCKPNMANPKSKLQKNRAAHTALVKQDAIRLAEQARWKAKACPGLTPDVDSRIATYLYRTAAPGGGAKPLGTIQKQVLGSPKYKERRDKNRTAHRITPLSPSSKKDVSDREECEQLWRNVHQKMQVRSMKCTLKASLSGGPCAHCADLLKHKVFTKASNRQGASLDTIKYTSTKFIDGAWKDLFKRHAGLAQLMKEDGKESVLLKFAKMAVADTESKLDLMMGMIEGVYEAKKREAEGKTKAGLVRSPIFHNAMHTLALYSPRGYLPICEQLDGPTLRSFR